MKNNYVLQHNFNYGTETKDNDSIINKLLLRNVQDLNNYIDLLLKDVLINVKLKDCIVSNMLSEPDTKIIIELIYFN